MTSLQPSPGTGPPCHPLAFALTLVRLPGMTGRMTCASPEILCVGAVLWDIIGRTSAAMAPGDDVPGRITWMLPRWPREAPPPALTTTGLLRDSKQTWDAISSSSWQSSRSQPLWCARSLLPSVVVGRHCHVHDSDQGPN